MGITLLSKRTPAGNLLDVLRVRDIRDGVVCLHPAQKREKEYGAVIAVNPVNFSLMSEDEQEAILEGFRVLLQRLQQHEQISIHIRTRPYDISPYLGQLREAQRSATSAAMHDMARDHEEFIRSLANEHAILQREFYIRVSARPEKAKRRFLPEEVFERIKNQLARTCEDILDDLARSSLSGFRLGDEALAHYYLACIHAHYAEQFPLASINLQALDMPLQPIRLRNLEPVSEFAPVFSEEEDETMTALAPLTETDGDAETTESEPAEPLPTPSASGAMPKEDAPAPQQKKQPAAWRWGKKKQPAEPTPHSTLVELLQPASLEQKKHYIQIHKETTEYFRARAVIGYPAFVVAGWLDRLIQTDEPYIDILLYLETLDPRSYMRRLTRRITSFRATQIVENRAGRVEDPHIAAALDDVESLRQQIVAQVEQVHSVSLYVCSRAASIPELRQRDEKMVSLLRGLDLESVEQEYEHLQTWLSCLPDNRDLSRRRKILETSSVVTAFPFASASLSTEPGSLVGVMPSGSLVIINPASDQLENGHEVMFARSGAGKSYGGKVRLSRNLQMGLEAIVIDPEDEYLPLCRKFNGANIRLSSGRLQLNPFDLAYSDTKERDLLEEKIQSLLVLFDILLADGDILSQREKAYLTRCITRTYAMKGITSDPYTHRNSPPNMRDLAEVIRSEECGADTFELAPRLERHLPSFPEQTETLLDNPLVVFNIRDLSDELKPVAVYLITEFVWTQIRREKRPRPRLLVIDEAWVLMQFSTGGRFLASMARRARKYNLSLWVITQDVEDFLGSEHGRTILKNASCKFLMKQDASTIDAVSQAFRLSEGERRYLLSCNRGEGLYFCKLSHVPLRIIASATEHRLATTNAQELLKEELARQAQRERERHQFQGEAIAVEQRRGEFDVLLPQFYTAANGHDQGS